MKKYFAILAALSMVLAVSCNKDDKGGNKTLDVDLTFDTQLATLQYADAIEISAIASEAVATKAEAVLVSGSEGNWKACGEVQELTLDAVNVSGLFFIDSKAATGLQITLSDGKSSKEFVYPIAKVEGEMNVDIYTNDAMKMMADSMVQNFVNTPSLYPVEFTGKGSECPSFFCMHPVKVNGEVKHVLNLTEARSLDGQNLSFAWVNVLQNTANRAYIGGQRGYMFSGCRASSLGGGTTGRQCDIYEVEGHQIKDANIDYNFGMTVVPGSWSNSYNEELFKFIDALYIKIDEKCETELSKIKANYYLSQIQKVLDNSTIGVEENPTSLANKTYLRRYGEAGDTSSKAFVENFRAGDYVILKSKRGTEESPVYYYGILQVMQLFDDSGSMAVKEDTGKQYIDRQKGHDLFYKPNYFSVKTQCEILK